MTSLGFTSWNSTASIPASVILLLVLSWKVLRACGPNSASTHPASRTDAWKASFQQQPPSAILIPVKHRAELNSLMVTLSCVALRPFQKYSFVLTAITWYSANQKMALKLVWIPMKSIFCFANKTRKDYPKLTVVSVVSVAVTKITHICLAG